MLTADEVHAGVREEIVATLGVEAEEVVPTANFFTDLGGESIDVLDLDFRCEKRFGLKIQFNQMLTAERIKTDAQGRLTPDCAAEIHSMLPSLDVTKVRANLAAADIQGMFTVSVITDYVRWRVTQAGVLAMA